LCDGRGVRNVALIMSTPLVLVVVSLLIFWLALVLLVGLAYAALGRDAEARAEIGWGRFGARFSVHPQMGVGADDSPPSGARDDDTAGRQRLPPGCTSRGVADER
jgi:uncharacterized protein (DUF58 family)